MSVGLEYVSVKKESKFLLALINSIKINISFFIKLINGLTALATDRIQPRMSRTQYQAEQAKSESI